MDHAGVHRLADERVDHSADAVDDGSKIYFVHSHNWRFYREFREPTIKPPPLCSLCPLW